MTWHSIKEAQLLTKKSRRTLYRDMASGQLSWTTSSDGHRQIETSELLRAYGAFTDQSAIGTEATAHTGTPDGTDGMRLVLAELQALRAEIASLKESMMLIEHKPEQAADKPETATAKPILAWWKRLTTSN